MTIKEKLQIIRKMLGLTQSGLAQKIGVSFATFNSWWNEKSYPRTKTEKEIDELFKEVTGQKIIPESQLESKRKIIEKKSSEYKSIVGEILENPDIYKEFALKLTYHTNKIEGSILTEPDTAAILFDNVSIPDKSITEQLEAKNHQAAFDCVLKYVSKNLEIDEAFVLRIHSILMNGIRPDAGSYRNHAVRIVGTNLPTANYLKVPELVLGIMPLARKTKKDAVSMATEFHARFEQIHPFSDGNGRVGRLLLAAMLLKNNIAPAIIREEQKQLYYTYLYKAQTKDDQSQLENFICDGIMEGFRILERK